MPTVLHLSDLHVGNDHGFLLPGEAVTIGQKETTLADAILEDLQLLRIADVAALVVSGDLTSNGQWKQNQGHVLRVLDALCRGLKIDRSRCLVVPGNHDFEWYEKNDQGDFLRKILTTGAGQAPDLAVDHSHETAFRTAMSQFFTVPVITPIDRVVKINGDGYEIRFGLLDSCRLTSTAFHEYGYVDRTHLRRILRELVDDDDCPALKVLVLHHHVTPVVPTEEPARPAVSITLNAGELIDRALETGVSLVMHGHQHLPAIGRIDRMISRDDQWSGLDGYGIAVLSAGSAGVRGERRRAGIPNTYGILRFEKDRLEVILRKIRAVDGPWGRYIGKEFPLDRLHGWRW